MAAVRIARGPIDEELFSESRIMEAEKQTHRPILPGEPAAGLRRTSARRIDRAPSPRRLNGAPAWGHGYGRAPGEGA